MRRRMYTIRTPKWGMIFVCIFIYVHRVVLMVFYFHFLFFWIFFCTFYILGSHDSFHFGVCLAKRKWEQGKANKWMYIWGSEGINSGWWECTFEMRRDKFFFFCCEHTKKYYCMDILAMGGRGGVFLPKSVEKIW